MGILGLSDVGVNAVVDGAGAAIGAPGLSTDDALTSLGPTGADFVANMGGVPFLGVNTFMVADGVGPNGRTAILVTDQIAPRIARGTGVAPALGLTCGAFAGGAVVPANFPIVANGDCSPLNTAAVDGDANWEVGDTMAAAGGFTAVIQFTEPVFMGATPAALLTDAQATFAFTPTPAAASTAMYTAFAATSAITAATANSVTIMFDISAGTVAVDDSIVITMLSDLAGNSIDPTADQAVITMAGAGDGGAPSGVRLQ
jgi:hypothetical protein